MPTPDIELLTTHVSKIFQIEDVTAGDPREWLVRYRGKFINDDTVAAYDQLADAVRPYDITPLFRKEERGMPVIFLTSVLPETTKLSNPIVNVALFFLTIFAMMLTAVNTPSEVALQGMFATVVYNFQHSIEGWQFAAAMMGILLAHEMGHYLACRYYKVPATLPYFLPAPLLSPLGTLGAFIMMKGVPKNKRVLFDVGVAGPIAGLIVTIPVLLYGLSISPLGPVAPAPAGLSGMLEGNSIFYLFAKFIVFGEWLPQPADTNGLSLPLYWLQYFFTGAPVPFGGMDVQLHSVALAGWGGLLVTALNLMPVGMLDGGHVVYGLFGERAQKLFPVMLRVLVAISILPAILFLSLNAVNSSWMLWVLILFFMGNKHVQPLDDITELNAPRRMLGFVMLTVFILIFTPVPMMLY